MTFSQKLMMVCAMVTLAAAWCHADHTTGGKACFTDFHGVRTTCGLSLSHVVTAGLFPVGMGQCGITNKENKSYE